MKKAFITGAASGIGKATAEKLMKEGWFVGLYDINKELLDEVSKNYDIEEYCKGRCDVTDEQSIQEAFTHFSEETNGEMHLLVNNAGVLFGGSFEEIPYENVALTMDVNIKGLTAVAYYGFSLLSKTPGSILVNLSSASCIYGVPKLAVYSASKFYVKGLTEALDLEWAEDDIRVLSIMPPFVDTKMLEGVPDSVMKIMKVELTPADIAKQIYNAVQGKRMHYLMTLKARIWNNTNRVLGENWRRTLVKYLANI